MSIDQADENFARCINGETNLMLMVNQMESLEIRGTNLSFVYVLEDNRMTIQGDVLASNGNTWNFDITITDIKIDKERSNCSTTLTAADGSTINAQDSTCGVIMSPISS